MEIQTDKYNTYRVIKYLIIVAICFCHTSCGGFSIPIGGTDSPGESIDKYGDFRGTKALFSIGL